MNFRNQLKASVLQLQPESVEFEVLALEVFRFQYRENTIYRRYVDFLKRDISQIDRIQKIPFLPIRFFKEQSILSTIEPVSMIFESSGTTGHISSRHHVIDLPYYEAISRKTFEMFYGLLSDYHVFALLPSYLERSNSSLVYMVQHFIYHSYSNKGGFFLNDMHSLVEKMTQITDRKILLWGVTFALLDLAEDAELSKKIRNLSSDLVVMETGGMKGRRKELIRKELHDKLKTAFGITSIHAEYGMTELLSQAYAQFNGKFSCPPHMRIFLREVNDPFSYLPHFALGNLHVKYRGKSGGINIIDLANIDSCAFIETQDLGSYTDDYKQFQVLGRFDNSDLRGCSLLSV